MLRLAALSVVAAGALGAAPASAATTYLVDQRNPRCADAGPGSAAAPFCTIGAGAARALARDTVRVRAGTYAEQVTVTRSGTAATARITFLAEPGATLTGRANGFTLSGVRWVTVRGFAVVGTASHGLQVTGSSHVTLTRNRVRRAGGSGIYVADSSDVLLAGNRAARSTDYGIELVRDRRFTIRGGQVTRSGRPAEGATRKGVYVAGCQGGLVTRAVVDRNSDSGIYLTGGTTGVRVEGNVARGNARGYVRAAAGIELRDATGDVVAGNRSYGNEDSGIQLSPGAADNLVVNNVVFGNGDHGIHALDAARARIVGNSIYRNATTGINVEGGSTSATIENNISVDNGLTHPPTQGDIRVDGAASTGVVVDYNLVYLTSPGVLYAWGSKQYGSLAALRAAVPGVEAHGLQADPGWAAPGSGDFRLRAGSPAIDSADSGASGALAFDAQHQSRFDDPAMPNTGAGPRPFDDRGALEFR